MISVLILTHNEEINLRGCLESVAWCNDVIVFDSFSTDQTVEIAREYGARVFQRKFDNYGVQREAARNVCYRNNWVLALDADERPDEQLVDELHRIASASDSLSAYRMRRKDHFMGKWIKHSSLYPSWFVRFYQPNRIQYEARAVHEYPSVEGEVGEVSGHLLHFSFNKGLEDWLHKHVRYSKMEAAENVSSNNSKPLDVAGLFSVSDPVRRRRALKTLSMKVPMRPMMRFIYMYFLRGGILDGWQGLQYCKMLSMYEQMIVYQMRDLKHLSPSTPATIRKIEAIPAEPTRRAA